MAMGNFKKQNLILIFTLLLTQFFFNCVNKKNEESNIEYLNNKKMENSEIPKRFDISNYESNIKKNPFYTGFQKDTETFVKQYHTIKEGYVEEKYTRELVQNYVEEVIIQNRFRDIYTFDNKGILQSLKHYFGNDLEVGEWTYYQNDKRMKVEDKDIGYEFNIHDVINYGKKNKINLLKTGEISKIKFGSLNTFCWQIKWNTGILDKDGESYRFKEVILDGKTGKELSSNEFFMNPLSR